MAKHAILQQLGLTGPQVEAYEFLLSNGPTPPPAVAAKLKLTRTNAYKVLDQLGGLGLISKSKLNKKLVYKAEDPIALASLVANERVRLIALEKNIKDALLELRQDYQTVEAKSELQTYQGADAVESLYEQQAEIKEPIYFIKTREDIPFMGYETMDKIRRIPSKYHTPRYGIIPDAPEASRNPALDKETNLHKTWINSTAYTAPVEWTVSGDEFMIITYSGHISAIRIKNQIVADAFRQLWQVFSDNLKANPDYKKMPRHAKRSI